MKKLFSLFIALLFISIAQAQNVGIGTATPTFAKLHVQGMVGNTVAMFNDSVTLQGIALVADWPGIFFNSYWNGGVKSMSASGYPSFINSEQSNGDISFNLSDVANTAANAFVTVPERMRITSSGTIGIGTTTPAPSAALDVSSTTKGFLPPRMSQSQRDLISPEEGLIVYNITTKKPNYYNGTVWKNFDGTCANTITITIGDNYQGGKVAYILQPGDPGFIECEEHGLIAAASDQSTGAEWGCDGTEILGADGINLGTGNQNTIDIMAGCATAGIAARICGDLVLNGYSDWYLPSKNELNKLYINRVAVGGFSGLRYWSSSEYTFFTSLAWFQDFSSGFQGTIDKNPPYHVRAVRAF